MLFDTHTHLDQPEFDDNRDEIVGRARDAGVDHLIAVGTTLETSRKCVEIAAKYEGVYAAVGIQPNYVAESNPRDWDEVVRLVEAPQVVAIGETGLDRHWDYTPFAAQQEYFIRHIELARERNLPFIVHMRDCDADIIESLRSAFQGDPLHGVMHSFTGDASMAAECLDFGMHISFAGMVTFKNAGDLRNCAAAIPDDRLLIETDCPYLSPEPVRRTKPNEPALVRYTAQCLAEVRNVSLESLAQTTTRNARELFGLS